MLSNKHLFLTLTLTSLLLLSGCASNRSILAIDLPETQTPVAQDRGTVFIQSVEDQRRFEENPRSQDIPSLGFGGAASAPEDIKQRAVGRKRNGFGKAMGDMLLAEDQSVERVIREALQQAFVESGYRIIEDSSQIDARTVVVDVGIRQFWAYMTPGFWALKLSCDITTDLKITTGTPSGRKTEQIAVKSSGNYQVATEGNWSGIIAKSVREYISKAKSVASGL